MLNPEQILGDIPTTKEVYKTSFKYFMAMCIGTVLVSLVGSIDIMMVGGLGAHAIAAVVLLINQNLYFLL